METIGNVAIRRWGSGLWTIAAFGICNQTSLGPLPKILWALGAMCFNKLFLSRSPRQTLNPKPCKVNNSFSCRRLTSQSPKALNLYPCTAT